MWIRVVVGMCAGVLAVTCGAQVRSERLNADPSAVQIWAVTLPVTLPGTTGGVSGLTPSGSFGYSLDQIARNNDAALAGAKQVRPGQRTGSLDRTLRELQRAFPSLTISMVEVPADELEDRMQKAAGTGEVPDLLLSEGLYEEGMLAHSDLLRHTALLPLGRADFVPQTEFDSRDRGPGVHALILAGSTHPVEVRQMMLLLRDPSACVSRCSPPGADTDAAAAVAVAAFDRVLHGGTVGTAGDREMAEVNGDLAARMALASREDVGAIEVMVETTNARANSRFAVVEVRARLNAKSAFGIVFGLVVLRMDEQGHWRVLQLTPSLLAAQEHRAFERLAGFTAPGKESVAGPGVLLASPKDGELRQGMPELWWDNLGGATLQVVEWQQRSGGGLSASELYFVPDSGSKLRTRVLARFATGGGYRWRVWSVSVGGSVRVGGWRSMTIQ